MLFCSWQYLFWLLRNFRRRSHPSNGVLALVWRCWVKTPAAFRAKTSIVVPQPRLDGWNMENGNNRNQEERLREVREDHRLPADWTESEWFEVWLKLARREYRPAEEHETAA